MQLIQQKILSLFDYFHKKRVVDGFSGLWWELGKELNDSCVFRDRFMTDIDNRVAGSSLFNRSREVDLERDVSSKRQI